MPNTQRTDRELLSAWWSEAMNTGLWAASWSKSLEGLTPEQAAWSPPSAPGVSRAQPHHSIWKFVLHMLYWREAWLRRLATGQHTTPEEVAAKNFPVITDTSPAAWSAVKARFADTQSRLAAAFAQPPSTDPANAVSEETLKQMMYLLPHDSYHFGQINYLRAMQGLPPIE